MKKLIGLLGVCATTCVSLGGEWAFANDTITDGNWTLGAQFNASAKTLTITGYRSGSGVLDLDDPVVNGLAVQNVYFWNEVFAYQKAALTEFRCNRFWQPDKNNMTWALFRYNQSLTKLSLGGTGGVHLWADFVRGCSNLVSIVLDLPNQTNIASSAFAQTPKLEMVVIRSAKRMTLPVKFFQDRAALRSVTLDLPQNAEIPDYLFDKCKALSELELNLGEVTKIGALAFNSCGKLKTNVAALCPPSVSAVATRAFEGCLELSGDLVLTNLQYFGDGAFAWTKLSRAELRGPIVQSGWKNDAYGNGVRFSGVITLKEVVFDLPNLTRLDSGDFENCWALSSVYFWRKPFNATSLRHLLNGKGLSAKTCTLLVSPQQWPFAERATSGWRVLTTAERMDVRKPTRCLGMCDVGDPSVIENAELKLTQQRLAWFARWNSPYDVMQGFAFTLR